MSSVQSDFEELGRQIDVELEKLRFKIEVLERTIEELEKQRDRDHLLIGSSASDKGV